ncbi:hypothetical protein ABW21_db0207542 [Orbilia brochopaga]|nr:hypothetical protein ABW21_db0207542 [Drechslerella brochopaga]
MSDQVTQPLLQSPPPYDEKANTCEPAASEKDPEKMLEAGIHDPEKSLRSKRILSPRLGDPDLPRPFKLLRTLLLILFTAAVILSLIQIFGSEDLILATIYPWILSCNAASVTIVLWMLMIAYRNPVEFFGNWRRVFGLVVYAGVVVISVNDGLVQPWLRERNGPWPVESSN